MSKRKREKEQRGRVQVGARHTDADLFHQWEEAEERAEKWEKTAREERKQHEWAISDVRAELRRANGQYQMCERSCGEKWRR